MTESPSENIKCLVRCRPLNDKEKGLGVKCITIGSDSKTILVENKTEQQKSEMRQLQYTMDKVFDEDITQVELFQEVGMPILNSFLSGYNCTIFCYGQTGAGKTHTMMGPLEALYETNAESHGLIPRILDFIFNEHEKVNNIITNNTTDKCSKIKVEVKTCCMEIYQENIIDLLANVQNEKENNKENNKGQQQIQNLKVKEDAKRGMYIDGITEAAVSNAKEAKDIILKGLKSRHVAATAMNAESSRSHLIFTIYLSASYLRNEGGSVSKTSRLHLIDLAGSERQKATKAEGNRIKEAGMINKSLSSLGNVINALVENCDGKNKYVPFRDSKLTHFLKDSLGGNSKTTICANISLSIIQINETISTLKFVQRAKMIKNKATVNVNVQENIQCLQDEIKKLKNILASHGLTSLIASNGGKIKDEKGNLVDAPVVPVQIAPDGNFLCPICHNEPYEISEASMILKLKEDIVKLITSVCENFKCENKISSFFNNLTIELNGAGVQFLATIDKYNKEYDEALKSLKKLVEKFTGFVEKNKNDFEEIKNGIKEFKGKDIIDKIFMEKVNLIIDNLFELKTKFSSCDVDEYLKLKTQNQALMNENEALNELKQITSKKDSIEKCEEEIKSNSNDIAVIVDQFKQSNSDIKNFFAKNFLNKSVFQGDLVLVEQSKLDLLELQINEGKSKEYSLQKQIESLENDNFLLSIDIIRLKERNKSLLSDAKTPSKTNLLSIKDEDKEEDKLSKVESVESSESDEETPNELNLNTEPNPSTEMTSEPVIPLTRSGTVKRSRKGIFLPSGSESQVSYTSLAGKMSLGYGSPNLAVQNVEIIRMKENYDELQDQFNEKLLENEELCKKIEELNNKVKEMNESIEEKESTLKQYKEENDTLIMTNEIFEKNIEDLNTEKKEMQIIIDEVKSMCDSNIKTINEISEQYNNGMNKLQNLYTKVNEKLYQSVFSNINEISESEREIHKILEASYETINDMSNNYDSLYMKSNRKSKQLLDIMENILTSKISKENELNSKLNELNVKNEQLSSEIKEKEQIIVKKEEDNKDISTIRDKLNSELNEKNDKITQLKSLIADKEKSLALMIEDSDNKRKEIFRIKDQSDKLKLDNDTLLIDKESLTKQNVSNLKLIKEQSAKIVELTSLNENKDRDILQYKYNLSTLTKTKEENENKINELQSMNLSLTSQLQSITSENSNLMKKIGKNEIMLEESKRIQKELNEENERISNLVNEKNNIIIEDHKRIDNLLSEKGILNEKINSLSIIKNSLTKENESKTNTINSIISEKDALEEKLSQIKKEHLNIKIDLDKAQSELLSQKNEIINQKEEKEKNSYLLQSLKKETQKLIEIKNDTIKSMHHTLYELSIKINESNKEKDKLSTQNELSQKILFLSEDMIKDYDIYLKKEKKKDENKNIDLFLLEKQKIYKTQMKKIDDDITQKKKQSDSLAKEYIDIFNNYKINLCTYHTNENTSFSLLKEQSELSNKKNNDAINLLLQIINDKSPITIQIIQLVKDYIASNTQWVDTLENTISSIQKIIQSISEEYDFILNHLVLIDISTNIELFNELKSSLYIYKEQYESLISFFVSQRELFSYYTQRLSNLLIVLNSLSQSSTDDILSTYQSSLLSSSLSHQTLPQTITAYNTSSISQIKQNIISLYNNFTSLKNALSGLYRNEFVLSSLPDHFSKSKLILKQKDTEAKNKILEDKMRLILGKKYNMDNLYNGTTIEVFWNTSAIPKLSKKLMILKEQKQKLKNEISLLNCDFNKSLTSNAADAKVRMLFVIREENKKLKNEISDLKSKNKTLEQQINKINELSEINKNYNILIDTVLSENDFNSVNGSKDSINTNTESKFKIAMNILKSKRNNGISNSYGDY